MISKDHETNLFLTENVQRFNKENMLILQLLNHAFEEKCCITFLGHYSLINNRF